MVLGDLGFSHSFISEIALYFSDQSCSGFEKIGLILIFAFASLVLFDPINHQEQVCSFQNFQIDTLRIVFV
ncbi:hypothetical protein EV2_027053 [Malus domestica]